MRIRDFSCRQATRDEIEVKVKDNLWNEKTELPENFATDEIKGKIDAMFAHLVKSVRHHT